MENKDYDFPIEVVHEGTTKVLVPKLKAFVKSSSEYAPSKAPVFYNPTMEFNRDLSVLALQAYQKMLGKEVSICEPLTGCGVRGIRCAVEIKGVKGVLINDISDSAFHLAQKNAEINNVSKPVMAKNEEANRLLSHYNVPHRRFDIIDVDPFGSPVPYLDSAIRALRDGGLLALTATDMAPLCGVYPKACIRKYGGKPLRTEYCHELAIRLLAGCAAVTAAKQNIGINVIFSHCSDHYIRLYFIISYGAKKADESLKNMGYILHCFKCFNRETRKTFPTIGFDDKKCSECGSQMEITGPLWLGKLVDRQFCMAMRKESEKRMFRNKQKITKILILIENEADAPPTYYVLDSICDKLALPVPSVKKMHAVLRQKGFQACFTHFTTKGVRTNASAKEVVELCKQLISQY